MNTRVREDLQASEHSSGRSALVAAIRPELRRPLLIALVFYAFFIGTLVAKGTEAALPLFIMCNAALFLLAIIASLASVRAQVRSAVVSNTWDELIITPLTDREIVNAQLGSALRPVALLAAISLPSAVLLVLMIALDVLAELVWPQALLRLLTITIALALGYAVAIVIVACLAVLSFSAALSGRGWAQGLGLGFLMLLGIVLLPVLTFFCFPIALLFPALCWYHHRVLCCTLRQRLLAGR